MNNDQDSEDIISETSNQYQTTLKRGNTNNTIGRRKCRTNKAIEAFLKRQNTLRGPSKNDKSKSPCTTTTNPSTREIFFKTIYPNMKVRSKVYITGKHTPCSEAFNEQIATTKNHILHSAIRKYMKKIDGNKIDVFNIYTKAPSKITASRNMRNRARSFLLA